jgi:hypothetical protein
LFIIGQRGIGGRELEIKQRQLIIDMPENLAGFELKLVVWLSAMAIKIRQKFLLSYIILAMAILDPTTKLN